MSKRWRCVLMVFVLFASPVLANIQPLCIESICHEDSEASTQKPTKSQHISAVHHCCCHVGVADRKLESPCLVAPVSGAATILSLNSDQVGLYQPGPLLEPPSHA